MKRVDEQGLSQYLDKRDQETGNRQPGAGLQGTVSAIKGQAGSYQVQIVSTTRSTSDGHWYPVQSNGQVPIIGDQVQIIWQDGQVGWVTSILSSPRNVDQHHYRVRLYYLNLGNPAIPNGWNIFNFGNVDYDPAAMSVSANYVVVPLAGQYAIACCCAVTQSTGCVAGIAINGSQVRAGVSAGTSQVVTTMALNKGDQVQMWLFANGASNIQGFSDRNWMTVDLINAF